MKSKIASPRLKAPFIFIYAFMAFNKISITLIGFLAERAQNKLNGAVRDGSRAAEKRVPRAQTHTDLNSPGAGLRRHKHAANIPIASDKSDDQCSRPCHHFAICMLRILQCANCWWKRGQQDGAREKAIVATHDIPP